VGNGVTMEAEESPLLRFFYQKTACENIAEE
jgi:hypothetical protein